jgi:FRG domain
VHCEWNDERLALKWKTDIGTSGSSELPRTKAAQPSICERLAVHDWQEFKAFVSGLSSYRNMFRGQSDKWRLRTPFHRTGRADIKRYYSIDVPTLYRHLSARTSHVFNLTQPLGFAAFLNLAQRHGYPTPALDWTYSPFVAAFFAYYGVNSSDAVRAAADRKVRILVFDGVQWQADFPQIALLANRRPHFSIIEPVAINNERLIPQQALFGLSTVDDIESHIALAEVSKQKRYLRAIDLPLRERDLVVKELRMMGITPGSLFPGLGGACAELKDRFFKL